MAVFYDNKGNERYFDLTLGSIAKVYNYLGIDMTYCPKNISAAEKESFLADVEKLFKVLWMLTRKEKESWDEWFSCLNDSIAKKIIELFVEEYKKCFKTSVEVKGKKDNSPPKEITYRSFVEMAGSCGCTNFKELTPGELIDYKFAHDKTKWLLQSVLLAVINNTHCMRQADIRKPEDFNPFLKDKEEEIVCDFIDLLTGGK